jgi:hypothetical protein
MRMVAADWRILLSFVLSSVVEVVVAWGGMGR